MAHDPTVSISINAGYDTSTGKRGVFIFRRTAARRSSYMTLTNVSDDDALDVLVRLYIELKHTFDEQNACHPRIGHNSQCGIEYEAPSWTTYVRDPRKGNVAVHSLHTSTSYYKSLMPQRQRRAKKP